MMDTCDAVPPSSFLCNNPQNPNMADSDDRLQTFQNPKWKNNLEVTERELADAGFYYFGESDILKCWYCSGMLKNWKKTDRPWKEHAMWYPLCEYVLQKQGVRFVEEIIMKTLNFHAQQLQMHQTINVWKIYRNFYNQELDCFC